MIKILTRSDKQTEKIGFHLGRILNKGDIVCFSGGLGVGKTMFIKGIAKSRGIIEPATSPTFTLINEYMGDIPIYHFDVYRISDPEEMYEIGFEEYIFGDGIVLIEWADLIKSILPTNTSSSNIIWIYIDKPYEYTENTINNRIIKVDFSQNKTKETKETKDIKEAFLNLINKEEMNINPVIDSDIDPGIDSTKEPEKEGEN